MRSDLLGVNGSTDEFFQPGITRGLFHAKESSLTDVPNARSKTETQQMAERKRVIGEPGTVSIVLLDLEFRLMVEESVEHVRCIAHSGVDQFGVKWCVLIRDVGIECHAGIGPITRINLSSDITSAAGTESLTVG